MSPKNPQMVATTNQAEPRNWCTSLGWVLQITLHFDSRFNFGSLFCMSNMCCVCHTSRICAFFSEHLLFSQAKVLQSSRTILSFSWSIAQIWWYSSSSNSACWDVHISSHLFSTCISLSLPKKTSHTHKPWRIWRSLPASWEDSPIVHRKVRKIGQQEMTKFLRDDNRGHYQPKQCIIIGESVKIIIHFYCLIPPIWSNLDNWIILWPLGESSQLVSD